MLGNRAISSAPKARCGVADFVWGSGLGLSCRGGALEFVAEVLKVFVADLHLQYFFVHRREVCQRQGLSQRRGAGGPYEPPRRGKHEGLLHWFHGPTALVQLSRQHSVRAADDTTRA